MPLTLVQRKTLETMALGLLFVGCAAFLEPAYKLLYNPSVSAPIGLYLFKPAQQFRVGAYVLARLPEPIETLASQRHYLPSDVPILKHVGALPGQSVCRERDLITVDGILVAHALERDRAGRKLPQWSGCYTLKTDQLFLLSTDNPHSFDSRYFGPISTSAVLGLALPFWTREP